MSDARKDDLDQGVPQHNAECAVRFRASLSAENWGETAITKAVENGQLVEFLNNGMCLGWRDRQISIKHALDIGQDKFAETLLPEGSAILDYAADCPRPEVIVEMVESGRVQWDEKYATSALSNLAKSGCVEFMEQLFQLHSPLREQTKLWEDAWWEAFTKACSNGKLGVVEWLMGHSLSHELCEKMKHLHGPSHPIVSAIKRGDIEVMQYLYEHELFPDMNCWTARKAFWDSPLASFKWLADHIWVDCPKQFSWAAAVALESGRMELLDFLQSLENPQGYEVVGNRRRRTGPIFSWSVDLVYYMYAARGGQVSMLKWLQENHRGEIQSGFSAMGIAASRGYLDTVKWLHVIQPEECGSEAIYPAAKNGHFEMVKWLDENCPVSCIQGVLVQAIRYGHLRIAYWLGKRHPDIQVTEYCGSEHKRLVSGCWDSSNALDVLLFLRAIYPGVLTPRFLQILREDYSDDYYEQHTSDLILGWLDENYPSTAETTD